MLIRKSNIVILPCLLLLCLFSCKKEIKESQPGISQTVKDKIFALGFSTDNMQKIKEGYLVEGDIILSEANLDQQPRTVFLRIAGNEQYRTSNLLTALPKV